MAKRKDRGRPIVLAIAGWDPSSGAGITADIKTIAAHGCYGVTSITALTVQSTRGVKRVDAIEGRQITETLEELATDLEISAVKIGMLGSAEAARSIAAFLKRHQPEIVVLDPIIRSSSGADLVSKEAFQILKGRILAQATVITPNLSEAAALTGMEVNNPVQMRAAASCLQHMGAKHVIITGGHLSSPVDLVFPCGGEPVFIEGEKITTNSTHGTGCAFSTSVACSLAKGKSLLQAARLAKQFVEVALRKAPRIGTGIGPVI